MAAECRSVDAKYVDELVHGLPIVGQVKPSGRWPSLKRSPAISMAEFNRKAWALREKLAGRLRRRGLNENSKALWDNTKSDVDEGHTIGPFYSYEEVDKVVGSKVWVITERIDVKQKGKVREVD